MSSSAAAPHEKTASVSNVENLVALLSQASEEVLIPDAQGPSATVEIEKVALAYNRLQTASCLDAMMKVASFEEKAKAEGYTNEQIEEVLSKTSAKKTLENLPILVAISGGLTKTEDKNSRPKYPKKKPTMDQLLGRIPVTRNLGW